MSLVSLPLIDSSERDDKAFWPLKMLVQRSTLMEQPLSSPAQHPVFLSSLGEEVRGWGQQVVSGWFSDNYTIAETTEDTCNASVRFGIQHSFNFTHILLTLSPQPDCRLHECRNWTCLGFPHHFIFSTYSEAGHSKNSICMYEVNIINV